MDLEKGRLYLVPTPIGNLKDITLRALEVLNEVDAILAEDTRQTVKLLKHFEIEKPLISHHQHNEHKTTERLVDELKGGRRYALVTDAGSPGISDPGFLITRACIEQGITVESLPGATAFVPALTNSGIPCDKFVFEGFLPQKKGRQTRLKELALEPRTMVLYESPYRLVKTLKQLQEYLGDRQASVSREITKLHEETKTGQLSTISAYYEEKGVKGECVIVVAGLSNKA